MDKHTIVLSARELHLMAKITGTLLGYAVPDRNCDRELIESIFNRTSEKLSELLITTASTPRRRDCVSGDGSFGVALFQALRARLRSHSPSGTLSSSSSSVMD
jgi:hypothetical protein